jgi:hypothetical protein
LPRPRPIIRQRSKFYERASRATQRQINGIASILGDPPSRHGLT